MPKGSGKDGNKAEAVERLWAAILGGTLTKPLAESLENRYYETPGGASFSGIIEWLVELGPRLSFPVASATRTPLVVNGDVDAALADGSTVKFEVKAQVKKPHFRDIVQSDWIRDQTDFLSRLVATEPAIATHFACVGAADLGNVGVDPNWSESSLHLADLVGLTDAAARRRAGVNSPAELGLFIDRKWFLHVTQEGARICNFCELAPIRHLLIGGRPRLKVHVNKKGKALRSLAPSGQTWFTYHFYRGSKLRGRHKMHSAALNGVSWI